MAQIQNGEIEDALILQVWRNCLSGNQHLKS